MICLNEMGFIGAENNRSKAYLQRLFKAGFCLSAGCVLTDPNNVHLPGQNTSVINKSVNPVLPDDPFMFDPEEDVQSTLLKMNSSVETLPVTDINNPNVLDYLKSREETVWIFSGVGGNILKRDVLSIGKRFLHMHPGAVPQYRGSTTFYYHLIRDRAVTVSAIFLSPGIDEGNLILQKTFLPPLDSAKIDYFYDPLIRSSTLLDVIRQYIASEFVFSPSKQEDVEAMVYYTIHPVLKHLAILSCDVPVK